MILYCRAAVAEDMLQSNKMPHHAIPDNSVATICSCGHKEVWLNKLAVWDKIVLEAFIRGYCPECCSRSFPDSPEFDVLMTMWGAEKWVFLSDIVEFLIGKDAWTMLDEIDKQHAEKRA